ncbi:MAG TPA: GNAT family N-acetyltransferase [Rhodanobacteraceae bacterium]|nr:GNAT family N-acetyltransferase [Rhodanobacteraceae bacterium]
MDDSQITIRRGGAADAAALAVFASRTFVDTFGPHNTPEDLRSHLASAFGVEQQTRELVDPDTVTLLAEAGGALLAYAQLRRKALPACVTQERPVELHRFYVDRRAHGRGVAQRLMATVRETAASHFGAKHLWLGVWEHNPRAIAFYAKCGFADVGSHDFFVGADRQRDRILVLSL